MAEQKTKGAMKIAVVRVRGEVRVRNDIRDTLKMLSLDRVNWMTVIDNTPTCMGMVKKAKDYITWGEVDAQLFESIVEKWGRKAGDAKLSKAEAKEFSKKLMAGETTFKEAGVKSSFRLHPPSRGYERGGVKQHVTLGGALGSRGKDINVLLAKMAGIKSESKKA